MNHILRGVNPGCGLPSNQDPKGTNATSLICVSLQLSVSRRETTQRKSNNISGADGFRVIVRWDIEYCNLVKYFPGIITWSTDHMEMCGCYFPNALCWAADRHWQNTIHSKWDLTAKAGSPDTIGYFHPKPSPENQHRAICCVNE